MPKRKCIYCLQYRDFEEFIVNSRGTRINRCTFCKDAVDTPKQQRKAYSYVPKVGADPKTYKDYGLSQSFATGLRARLHRYGMRISDYIDMHRSQKGKCAICEEPGGWELVIDHCHKTKQNRALLCTRCNSGLGMFKDSPELLVKASKYINDHKMP